MTSNEVLLLEKIKNERPPVHSTPQGNLRCVGLNSTSLDFIFSKARPDFLTLETGCGLSTLVFALAGCSHTAIVPNEKHIEETRNVAKKLGINLNSVTFIPQRSELYLPTLASAHKLDTILIDGGHAFPIPIIDWYYTQGRLKEMGFLIIDDVHLKAVSVLYDFLKLQPEWQKVEQYRKTTIFQKIADIHYDYEWDFWRTQPYNTSFKAKLGQFLTSIRFGLKRP
jgi:predicted O-methyltransferase YrrM